MLRIVDLTQHSKIACDVEITVYVSGDMLTVSLNVDDTCVARFSVPAGERLGDVIDKVAGQVATVPTVAGNGGRRLC